TLFGEKFIDLLLPDQMASSDLKDGDAIPESRTQGPIEVESILEKAVPIFGAVDPEKFGSALHALAQGFAGNVPHLRSAIEHSATLLTNTERTLPNFQRNLVHLKYFANALDQTDTDLIKALDGLSAVGDTINAHPDEFRTVIDQLDGVAGDLGDV